MTFATWHLGNGQGDLFIFKYIVCPGARVRSAHRVLPAGHRGGFSALTCDLCVSIGLLVFPALPAALVDSLVEIAGKWAEIMENPWPDGGWVEAFVFIFYYIYFMPLPSRGKCTERNPRDLIN